MLLLPAYSSEIAPAFSIVNELEKDIREVLFQLVRKGSEMDKLIWAAEFRMCRGSQNYFYAEANTVPLAICKAALLVINNIFEHGDKCHE